MRTKTILRSFLSVIPLIGMGFLFNSHTPCVNAQSEIKRAQSNDDFSTQLEVSADEELSVSVLSSTVTPTSHTFQVSFKTGGTGYQSRTKSFTVASNDGEFYTYINSINEMDVDDREALVQKIENGEETAPEFTGYITRIEKGTTDGNIIIPKVFTRNGLFNCNIEALDVASAISNWDNISSITIPNTVKTVSSLTFEGAPSGVVFNIQSPDLVPDGWDDDWLPQGAILNTNYDYDDLISKRDSTATQSGNPVSFGDPSKNYIIGYYPTNGEGAKPLIMEYELVEQPGVKYYQEFTKTSTNANYDSVGEQIIGRTNSISVNIDLEEGQTVNTESLVIYNIYPAVKDSNNNYVPDVTNSTGFYVNPVLMFKKQYNINQFISYEFKEVSSFAGYIGVAMNIDLVSPTIYSSLNPTYYKNNLANIEKGVTQIRYRLTALNSCSFKVTYQTDSGLVSDIVPISTPVSYHKLEKQTGNNVVFLVKTSALGEQFDVKNLVSFEMVNFFITVDLFLPENNAIIARSNVTTRFGTVLILPPNSSSINLFDIDLTLIIFAVSYIVVYCGIAIGLYFYLKNKFKNDEFRRIKTKKYIQKAGLGLAGLGIVLYAVLFVILRLTAFANSVVVFNPIDPFIIGFGIAAILAIGYFIRSLIITIKAEKQRRTTIKLQLDKDVDDDGTH